MTGGRRKNGWKNNHGMLRNHERAEAEYRCPKNRVCPDCGERHWHPMGQDVCVRCELAAAVARRHGRTCL